MSSILDKGNKNPLDNSPSKVLCASKVYDGIKEGGEMMSRIMLIPLRLVRELNDQLKKEAMARGISKNALIVQILWDWVNRETYKKRR